MLRGDFVWTPSDDLRFRLIAETTDIDRNGSARTLEEIRLSGPIIVNAAEADAQGLELETIWAVGDAWRIAAAVGVLDTNYTNPGDTFRACEGCVSSAYAP